MRQELVKLLNFIRELYPNEQPIPLHAPRFLGKEKDYLADCIDSTYVSYVGSYVTRFEEQIAQLTKAKHAIAMVNGTAALQMSLVAAGIQPGNEVITQALTFVATANGIVHAGGTPVFVDVDRDTLGMSPEALEDFLQRNAEKRLDGTFNRLTKQRIFAVMPMHTFGFICRIEEIARICQDWSILLIEDSAEALGSKVGEKHSGLFGQVACLSFNGNKPITTGGGGMLITNSDTIAKKARHISTTAKVKHAWNFFHDELGWNLRMPNLNAAVGAAQMERFAFILQNKRQTAHAYQVWGQEHGLKFVAERPGTTVNYWLNTLILANKSERDEFLEQTNSQGIQTRPIWALLSTLPMYCHNLSGPLTNSVWLEERVVNIPSSVRVQ